MEYVHSRSKRIYDALFVPNEVFEAEMTREFRRDLEHEIITAEYRKKFAHEKEELRLLEKI